MTTEQIIGYYFMGCGAALLPLAAWAARRQRMRRRVHDALNKAYRCGSFEPGGMLYDASPWGIAVNMVMYAEDFEDVPPHKFVAHVESWMEEKGLI